MHILACYNFNYAFHSFSSQCVYSKRPSLYLMATRTAGSFGNYWSLVMQLHKKNYLVQRNYSVLNHFFANKTEPNCCCVDLFITSLSIMRVYIHMHHCYLPVEKLKPKKKKLKKLSD